MGESPAVASMLSSAIESVAREVLHEAVERREQSTQEPRKLRPDDVQVSGGILRDRFAACNS